MDMKIDNSRNLVNVNLTVVVLVIITGIHREAGI
jgi:hypothetical protein